MIDFERNYFLAPLHNLPGVGMTGTIPGTMPGADLGDLPQMFHFY